MKLANPTPLDAETAKTGTRLLAVIDSFKPFLISSSESEPS
jgi:hypothetical protein